MALTRQDGLTIEYKADHSELASLVTAGQADLAMLPEPFVTTVTQKNPDIRIALGPDGRMEQNRRE